MRNPFMTVLQFLYRDNKDVKFEFEFEIVSCTLHRLLNPSKLVVIGRWLLFGGVLIEREHCILFFEFNS